MNSRLALKDNVSGSSPASHDLGTEGNGSAHIWSFAIYLASRDGYQDSVLPSGSPTGTAEDALDCACGLYLNDPTAWLQPPTN
jgi:hypothetical protein